MSKKYGQKRELGIVSLDDERLVRIDPTSEGFFENVLGYVTENEQIKAFIEAIKEVQEAELRPFWKPIYDPSLDGEEVVFKAGSIPAVRNSYDFWKQNYAFLVWLINILVKKGWTIEEALKAVVLDSKDLGHYCNSKIAKQDLEETGNRKVCEIYDLANTYKIFSCSNKEVGGFWLGGGRYGNLSFRYPLADLDHFDIVDNDCCDGVGWLVLS